MKQPENIFDLSDSSLKEIFSLFTSCTKHERAELYDTATNHYFEDIDILEEYYLHQEKREFAVDAVRSVIYFLHRSGYRLEKDGQIINLQNVDNLFL